MRKPSHNGTEILHSRDINSVMVIHTEVRSAGLWPRLHEHPENLILMPNTLTLFTTRRLAPIVLGLFSAHVFAGGTGIGAGISSLGFNVEVSQALTNNLALRLGYNSASYDTDGETDGIDYEYELDWSSANLTLDWHPFGNGFRLSVGALSNDNSIEAESKDLSGTVEVGDGNFTAAQVGRIEGDIEFDSFAPYAGIGWGRIPESGLGFMLDLGIAFQGSPDVELRSVDGVLSDDPTLNAALAEEEKQLEDDVEDFDLYPVIKLNLVYAL